MKQAFFFMLGNFYKRGKTIHLAMLTQHPCSLRPLPKCPPGADNFTCQVAKTRKDPDVSYCQKAKPQNPGIVFKAQRFLKIRRFVFFLAFWSLSPPPLGQGVMLFSTTKTGRNKSQEFTQSHDYSSWDYKKNVKYCMAKNRETWGHLVELLCSFQLPSLYFPPHPSTPTSQSEYKQSWTYISSYNVSHLQGL